MRRIREPPRLWARGEAIALSPDGERLLYRFELNDEAAFSVRTDAIYSVPTSGGAPIRLSPESHSGISYAGFSADGSMVEYHAGTSRAQPSSTCPPRVAKRPWLGGLLLSRCRTQTISARPRTVRFGCSSLDPASTPCRFLAGSRRFWLRGPAGGCRDRVLSGRPGRSRYQVPAVFSRGGVVLAFRYLPGVVGGRRNPSPDGR